MAFTLIPIMLLLAYLVAVLISGITILLGDKWSVREVVNHMNMPTPKQYSSDVRKFIRENFVSGQQE